MNGWSRRILLLAADPGEGRFTQPTAAVQTWRPERVLMPHRGPSMLSFVSSTPRQPPVTTGCARGRYSIRACAQLSLHRYPAFQYGVRRRRQGWVDRSCLHSRIRNCCRQLAARNAVMPPTRGWSIPATRCMSARAARPTRSAQSTRRSTGSTALSRGSSCVAAASPTCCARSASGWTGARSICASTWISSIRPAPRACALRLGAACRPARAWDRCAGGTAFRRLRHQHGQPAARRRRHDRVSRRQLSAPVPDPAMQAAAIDPALTAPAHAELECPVAVAG